MFPPLQDLYRVAPELVLCGFGMLVMFLAPIVPRARHSELAFISLLGTGLAIAATRLTATHPGLAYSGLFRADTFSLFVHLIVCGVSNWGAYGLATGVRLLRAEPHDAALYDLERERELLRIMVEGGPLVDGVSGKPSVTVDGLSFDTYAAPLRRMGELAAALW